MGQRIEGAKFFYFLHLCIEGLIIGCCTAVCFFDFLSLWNTEYLFTVKYIFIMKQLKLFSFLDIFNLYKIKENFFSSNLKLLLIDKLKQRIFFSLTFQTRRIITSFYAILMRNEIIFEYRFNIFYVLQNCLQISYSAYNIFSRVTVSICID